LHKEYLIFKTQADIYRQTKEKKFNLFVFRIESIIIKERGDITEKLTDYLIKNNNK